ncbi:MAG: YfcC family protein [Candidatus Aminicenantia bacterium]
MGKEGRRFKIPHTLVLMYILVLLMIIVSWLIPSGEYKRVEKNGRLIPLPETFHFVEKRYAGLEMSLIGPLKGFQDGALIIAFILVVGGAFSVIQTTGTIELAIGKITKYFSLKPHLQKFIIPVLMIIFSIGGTTFGMAEENIPFVLIFIPLAISLGYDSIVGVSIPFLGAAAGFASAVFNPFTAGIAQAISGLPLYSGVEYRLIAWFLGTFIVTSYVLIYAKKVKENPSISPVADLDATRSHILNDNLDVSLWNWRHKVVISIFIAGFGVLVFGILFKKWFITEIGGIFLAIGILSGLFGGLSPSKIAESFVSGAKDMVNVAFVIACGRALIIIANDAKILDTMLFYSSHFISLFPHILAAHMMFLTQCVINFFIHSGTAQAALTMPIMAPLSDLVGITRQTTVLAFLLCEFINPILPTSAVTMGILGVAKIPWERWAQWFLPLMLILVILSFFLLIPPVLLRLGPF